MYLTSRPAKFIDLHFGSGFDIARWGSQMVVLASFDTRVTFVDMNIDLTWELAQ